MKWCTACGRFPAAVAVNTPIPREGGQIRVTGGEDLVGETLEIYAVHDDGSVSAFAWQVPGDIRRFRLGDFVPLGEPEICKGCAVDALGLA